MFESYLTFFVSKIQGPSVWRGSSLFMSKKTKWKKENRMERSEISWYWKIEEKMITFMKKIDQVSSYHTRQNYKQILYSACQRKTENSLFTSSFPKHQQVYWIKYNLLVTHPYNGGKKMHPRNSQDQPWLYYTWYSFVIMSGFDLCLFNAFVLKFEEKIKICIRNFQRLDSIILPIR